MTNYLTSGVISQEDYANRIADLSVNFLKIWGPQEDTRTYKLSYPAKRGCMESFVRFLYPTKSSILFKEVKGFFNKTTTIVFSVTDYKQNLDNFEDNLKKEFNIKIVDYKV